MKKQWDKVCFDVEKRTLTIVDGEMETYDYRKLKKCSIACEDAKQRGKTKPFLHTVLVGSLQYSAMHPGNVFVGMIFEMEDATKAYAYISKHSVQVNSLKFHEDMKEAKEIKEFCDRIIQKYQS